MKTMCPSSSTSQLFCDNMPAVDDMSPQWEWAHWLVFMTSVYMYYAPCFVLVEHSLSLYIYI